MGLFFLARKAAKPQRKTLLFTSSSYPVGIPILPIYFLGESPESFEDVPILLVDRQARDYHILQPLERTNRFIDALFHKGLLDWLRGVIEVGKKALFDPSMIPLATSLFKLCIP